MNKIFLTFLSFICFYSVKAQTSGFSTYNIYCESITNIDASNEMGSYLMQNYSDRINSYIINLDTKIASITCDVEPIDLLQLYRMHGYSALYISDDGGRHFLNDNGQLIIRIKEN